MKAAAQNGSGNQKRNAETPGFKEGQCNDVSDADVFDQKQGIKHNPNKSHGGAECPLVADLSGDIERDQRPSGSKGSVENTSGKKQNAVSERYGSAGGGRLTAILLLPVEQGSGGAEGDKETHNELQPSFRKNGKCKHSHGHPQTAVLFPGHAG